MRHLTPTALRDYSSRALALAVSLALPATGWSQVGVQGPMFEGSGLGAAPIGVSVGVHQELAKQMDKLTGEPAQALSALESLWDAYAKDGKENDARAASRIVLGALAAREGYEATYQRLKSSGLPELTSVRLAGLSERWAKAAAAQPSVSRALDKCRDGFRERGVDPALLPALDHAALPAAARTAATAFMLPAVSKVVGELDTLAETDPAGAAKRACAILNDPSDRRIEVRLHALRTLGRVAGGAPSIVEHAKTLADNGGNYYLKRETARQIGLRADDVRACGGEAAAVAALKKLRADAAAPVRIAAGWALAKLGVDPGPEVEPKAPTPAPVARAEVPFNPRTAAMPRPPKGHFTRTLLVLGLILGGLGFMSAAFNPPAKPAPHAPQTISQTVDQAPSIGPATPAAPSDSAASAPAPTAEQAKADAQKQLVEQNKQILDQMKQQTEAQKSLADDVHQQIEKSNKASTPSLGSVLLELLRTFGLPILVLVFLFRVMSGGGAKGAMTQLSQIQYSLEKPKTTFDDVAGVDEAKLELAEIVDFLHNPGPYSRNGARVPKGVILYGPPGTGKTMLAKAVANATGANFIAIKGSDFIEMFVGVGAARARAVFQYAREHAPCIIFIDEFDAVAKARSGKNAMNSHDERDQTINAMLAEMDGFDNSNGVIVMAATNRLDMLDEAVTRPGRFDRKVEVGKPNVLGREAILAVHAANKRLAPEADLQFIAKRTSGLAGADLENVLNEGAMLQTRSGKDVLEMAELNEAVDKGNMGVRKDAYLSPEVRRRIATHEIGHVIARVATGGEISKVTIIGRGSTGGFAESVEKEDTFLYTESQLRSRITFALGSVAAEKTLLNELSTGAESDLQHANMMARAMVKLGMASDDGIGFYRPMPDEHSGFGGSDVGPEMRARIDKAVQKILAECGAAAVQAVRDYDATVKVLVDKLVEKETLTREEILSVLAANPPSKN